MRIAFGDFVLDTDARELQRSGQPVRLSPKAYQLLHVLTESRPRALSKAELNDRLWPETFVVDTNLANLVGELRQALGEDRRSQRYVRTVHGYGYAFRGEAAAAAPPAPPRASGYVLSWSGGRFPLAEGEHILGRDPDLALCFDSSKVSRHHARLQVEGGRVTLEDLGSKNGTSVNGHRLEAPVVLSDGDEIALGSLRLRLQCSGGAPSTETEASRD